MTDRLRLIIFDVDGTLVDSQNDIVSSMHAAFQAVGQATPPREALLSIVGLSLEEAFLELAPEQSRDARSMMVDQYKQSYQILRNANGPASSPLYPGARVALRALHKVPNWLLGIATGKSRRGLDALTNAHDIDPLFATKQVADTHPSKPHPSMLNTALAETGVEAQDAVMIGDTRFDMEMAHAAGIDFVGVSWGYHHPSSLQGAVHVLTDFSQLGAYLHQKWNH